MVVGGLLTTQYAQEGVPLGLIWRVMVGLALMGVVGLVVVLLGLRARRIPIKDVPVIAPRVKK
jgi:hypothetical protein